MKMKLVECHGHSQNENPFVPALYQPDCSADLGQSCIVSNRKKGEGDA